MIQAIARRTGLSVAGAWAVVVAVVIMSFVGSVRAADPAKPKHVILIYADDVGYGDLSSYGSQFTSTPNLDRLSQGGVRFTDANTPCPVCTASRYGLITGEYAWRRDVPGVAAGDSKLLIPTDIPTLPKTLKSAGYTTAIVGKWHLGFGERKPDWNASLRPGPLDVGFDSYFGLPSTNDRVPCVFVEDDRVVGLDPADPIKVWFGKKTETPPEGMTNHIAGRGRIGHMSGGRAAWWTDTDIADTTTRRACQVIEKNKDNNLFLLFTPHDIHTPIISHPRFAGTSKTGTRGDMLNELDWSVGEILNTLDRLGLTDDTLIIFSSDNGGAPTGSKDPTGHKVNGDLRGIKSNLWEGGSRVPLLVRWPKVVPAGKTSDQLICLIDMYATLTSMVGARLPDNAAPDSFDFSSVFRDPSITDPVRTWSMTANSLKDLTIRKDGWKYIPIPGGGGYTGKPAPKDAPPEQLYHLAVDPAETKNLIESESQKAKELRESRDAMVQAGSTRPGFKR